MHLGVKSVNLVLTGWSSLSLPWDGCLSLFVVKSVIFPANSDALLNSNMVEVSNPLNFPATLDSIAFKI